MWKSEKQIWNDLKDELSELKKSKKDELKWWNTLDMNCPYLIKVWSSMFGSIEQRISQLYIIRNNQSFKLK